MHCENYVALTFHFTEKQICQYISAKQSVTFLKVTSTLHHKIQIRKQVTQVRVKANTHYL